MDIPKYQGGILSPEIYDAGTGICDTRKNVAKELPHFADGAAMTEKELRDALALLDDEDIYYHYQYAPAGEISVRIYFGERMADALYKYGRISAKFLDPYEPEEMPRVTIQTVTETNRAEYDAYIALLEKAGLEKVYFAECEDNAFCEFALEQGIYRVQYTGGTVRMITDPVSVPLPRFNDSGEIYGKTTIWQYGLHHAKNRAGFTMDCGMCYVAALPDGSALMVDGGEYEQCTKEAVKGLMDLLHEICGEKIRLHWFCTHAHDDHIDMFAHILEYHHEEIDLQRVFFNFPSETYLDYLPDRYILFSRLKKYYPHAVYRKAHMGDRIILGGCRMDVLQTHEESTGKIGDEKIGWFNDTSTVLSICLDASCAPETRFLVLGDIDQSAEAVLLQNHTEKALKSGMVQTAHHLFNRLENVYKVIAPEIALVPQTCKVRTNHDKPKYDIVASVVPYEGFYFSDSGSDAFSVENGRITHIEHRARLGSVYDGTKL